MSSATRAEHAHSQPYTRLELWVDGAIHGVGIVGAAAAALLLVETARATRGVWDVAAVAVYVATLVLMPIVSAAYNLNPSPRWRHRLRPVDQGAIFLLIAGTYTPFGVIALGGGLGYALVSVVWLVAVAGVALKLTRPAWLSGRRSVALYLVLGWCALPALGQLLVALSPVALMFLAAGGVLYTVGVIFHLWVSLPFHNAIWHGFVVVAAACHVFAVKAVLAA